MIEKMKAASDPLIALYEHASALAGKAMERARQSGDYPLLSKGDVNIYALFVERAQALIKPDGIAGLVVPSGIASDLGASAFFRKVATSARVHCLFDFENRRGEKRQPFFRDIDSRFKFSVFVCGGPQRSVTATECAFFLRDPPEEGPDDQRFVLTAADFALVNPNTGTAPIFRTKRDAALTTAIFRRLPVLVEHSNGIDKKAWLVRYLRMFDMTNDSHLFWTRERLDQERAYPAGMGRWRQGGREWLPLYEGKMVQAFDHRAADVVVNGDNIHRPAQPEMLSDEEHADPQHSPNPQFWVDRTQAAKTQDLGWVLGFKEITSPTNIRTMIAALMPAVAFGNKTPLLLPDSPSGRNEWLLVAELNSFSHDYVVRQKLHGQTLNWFVVEQLPVLTPKHYTRRFGRRTAADIVKDHVLRLTYTAHDMAPFALRERGWLGEAAEHLGRSGAAPASRPPRCALLHSLRRHRG
jgi:hypothetical protein